MYEKEKWFSEYFRKNKIIGAIIFLLVLYLSYLLREVFLILFLAYLISTAISPVINLSQKAGLSRTLATLLFIIMLLTIILLLIIPVIPLITDQISTLLANLPEFIERINDNLPVRVIPENLFRSALGNLENISGGIFQVTGTFLEFVFNLLFLSFTTFYISSDKKRIKKILFWGLNQDQKKRANKIEAKVEENLGAWLRGQLIVSLAVGFFTWLTYIIIGLPFAFALAILAAILEIIPNLGPLLALTPALIIALTISPLMFVYTLAAYLLIQTLEGYLLVPKVMEKVVGFHPLVVVILIVLGSTLIGVWGALLAVPVGVVIKTFWTEQKDY